MTMECLPERKGIALKTVWRIIFGLASIFFFVVAAMSFQEAGLESATLLPAGVGSIFATLAILGKWG